LREADRSDPGVPGRVETDRDGDIANCSSTDPPSRPPATRRHREFDRPVASGSRLQKEPKLLICEELVSALDCRSRRKSSTCWRICRSSSGSAICSAPTISACWSISRSASRWCICISAASSRSRHGGTLRHTDPSLFV